MRKSIAAVVLGAAAIGLAGCGSMGADASPDHAGEVLYLAGLDRGAVPHADAAKAVGLGRSACAQLDAGASFTSVGFTVMNTGLEAEQAGYLIGTAVGTFCPQHLETLRLAAEQY